MKLFINELLQKYNALSPKLRASVWFTVCIFLQKGITTLSTPIFTRLLSEAEYGEYSVFNSWMDIVTIIVTLKLYAGIFLQGLIKYSDKRDEFASSFQGLTLTLALFWSLIYVLFHRFWNNLFSLSTVQMLAMLVMVWATAAFSLWSVSQRSVYRYRALLFITAITSIAKPGIGILFVLHADDKVTARILGLALVELVCYSGCFFAQMRRGKKFYSARFWIYALRFNIPLIPHYFSSVILGSSDRIIIKEMVGAREAGIYSVSYQLSQIMSLFASALDQSIKPWLYEKIKSNRVEDTRKVVYIVLSMMAGITTLVMLFAPEILAVFAPSGYSEAVWIMPPVMLSVYFIFNYLLFSAYEFYFEKTRYIAMATGISAVMNICLNFVCIKRFGYIAAGYTTLFCYIIMAFFHYFFMNRLSLERLGKCRLYNTKFIFGVGGILLAISILMPVIYENIIIRYSLIGAILITLVISRKKLFILFSWIMNANKTDRKS